MDKQISNRKKINNDGKEDATQMEINISNTNSNSQVVINDLELLKLVHLHPFLFSRAVRGFGEKDYEEWGWKQLATKFNDSYEGLELNTPFTVEELQWRWEALRPVCPSLGKACGKIPDSLWYTICKINRLLTLKPRVIVKPISNTQQFLLSQLPLLERLTDAQRRCLEVEVMDAILTQERNIHLEPLSKKAQSFAQSQYEEFLKTIGIKELAPCSAKSAALTNRITATTASNSKSSTNSEINPSGPINIVQCGDNKLIISGVHGLHRSPSRKQSFGAVSLDIKTEDDIFEAEEPLVSQAGTSSGNKLQLRYVPLRFAKYYTKKVRVRLKRFKYLPQIKELCYEND